jgi:hypothetical protein
MAIKEQVNFKNMILSPIVSRETKTWLNQAIFTLFFLKSLPKGFLFG